MACTPAAHPGGVRPSCLVFTQYAIVSIAWGIDAASGSIPVLLEIALIWAQTMMHVYYLLVKDSAFGGDGIVVTGAHLLNLTRSVLGVLAISHCCQSSVCEARRTERVVARLQATNRDAGGGRAVSLERFAKQLGAVRPELSACGLFSIDMPFLFNFFASMFGYLVILVQFDKAPESPQRNASVV